MNIDVHLLTTPNYNLNHAYLSIDHTHSHNPFSSAFFIRPFYKMLLGKSVTLVDMESVDTEFFNSVKYILENDPEPLCLTFSASRDFLGQVSWWAGQWRHFVLINNIIVLIFNCM